MNETETGSILMDASISSEIHDYELEEKSHRTTFSEMEGDPVSTFFHLVALIYRKRRNEIAHSQTQRTQLLSNIFPIAVEDGIDSVWTSPQAFIELQARLRDLQRKVSEPNWDGEGADPVEESTFKHATDFLHTLTLGQVENTQVDATPVGEILLTWDSEDENDSFDVIVGPEGEFSVAGMFHDLEVHGPINEKQMDNSLIHKILEWVSLSNGITRER